MTSDSSFSGDEVFNDSGVLSEVPGDSQNLSCKVNYFGAKEIGKDSISKTIGGSEHKVPLDTSKTASVCLKKSKTFLSRCLKSVKRSAGNPCTKGNGLGKKSECKKKFIPLDDGGKKRKRNGDSYKSIEQSAMTLESSANGSSPNKSLLGEINNEADFKLPLDGTPQSPSADVTPGCENEAISKDFEELIKPSPQLLTESSITFAFKV